MNENQEKHSRRIRRAIRGLAEAREYHARARAAKNIAGIGEAEESIYYWTKVIKHYASNHPDLLERVGSSRLSSLPSRSSESQHV